MDETRVNPGSEGQRSYGLVAIALLAVVVAVLVAAFFLDQHLRSHVGIQPLTASISKKRSSVPGRRGTVAHSSTIFPPAAVTITSVPTVKPTPTLSTRQLVTQAYYRYWQAYSRALYTLNTSHVGQVAAEGELRRIGAEVGGFRRQNYAVRVRVSHHAVIVSIKGGTATIYDEVLNRSFAIDPVTKQPGQGSNRTDLEKNIYTLTRIHGVWKVTLLLRQQG